jgi:periplasmic divalent cation tolerance protein
MGAIDAGEFIVVMTTLPDAGVAKALVRSLVDRRMIACGTVIDPVTSIYRWKGAVEESNEVQVLIKTHRDRFAELETAMRDLHPYDVPELLALPVAEGLNDYMTWVKTETAPGEAA